MQTKKNKITRSLVLTNLTVSTDEEIANRMYEFGRKNIKNNVLKCKKIIDENNSYLELNNIKSFSEAFDRLSSDTIFDILKKIFKYKFS